ncbi:hypothetical protein D3C77_661820 [compost metagenome]
MGAVLRPFAVVHLLRGNLFEVKVTQGRVGSWHHRRGDAGDPIGIGRHHAFQTTERDFGAIVKSFDAHCGHT